MKILYDHKIFSMQRYGGISRYICEVAARVLQRESGLVFGGVHDNAYLAPLSEQGLCRGTRLQPMRYTGRVRNQFNRAWFQSIIWGQKPDLVHETYYGGEFKTAPSTRRVVTVHDLLHETMPEYFGVDPLDAQWRRASLKQAHGVVCVSQCTADALKHLYGDDLPPSVVIHHGYNYETPSEDARLKIKAITGGRPSILYVGKRHHYKNFRTLWDAYCGSNWVQERLPLLCFGGEAFAPKELDELGAHPGAQCLSLTGDDDLLWAAYEQAAVFVYPSLAEGFGIPILEAHAAGCPVLCSSIPVFREVANEAAGYFQNTEELVVLLNRALTDAPWREALIRAGRQRLSHFGWALSAQKHHDFYQSLCAPCADGTQAWAPRLIA